MNCVKNLESTVYTFQLFQPKFLRRGMMILSDWYPHFDFFNHKILATQDYPTDYMGQLPKAHN